MQWVRAKGCEQGACVEQAVDADGNILLHNSQEPGTELLFTPDEWNAFLIGVKRGEFDLQ